MNNSVLPIVPQVYDSLFQFAQSDGFLSNWEITFGTNYDVVKTTELQQQWQSRDFSQLPSIEVVSDGVLGSASGAYASSTNKIYLSESFVNTASPASIVSVLLEEIGHYVDAQINQVDSGGDEGAIFAELVQGNHLEAETLQALQGENDQTTITVNGENVQVEQHNLTGSKVSASPLYSDTTLIVKLKSDITTAQADSFRQLMGVVGVTYIKLTGAEVWKLSGSMSVDKIIEQYGNNPLFQYIERDYIVNKGATFPNDPSFNQLWGLNNTGQSGGTADADIDAPEAWDIQTGNPNLVIGVIDTGADYNHPDLVGNIWTNPGEIAGDGIDNDGNGYIDDIRGWDFAYGDNNPMDVDSHGTHVSGTIAGKGNNGVGVTGVAWNAKIMPLKFLDDTGSGLTSNAILAINYATAQGVKLTNNSWGGGGYSQALYDAINAAGQAGALFIAAAGNSGVNTDSNPSYPASYNLANIISVASTTHTDSLSSFSNYGLTSVDLGAPGSDIYSTIPNGGYATYSGTSMASPHVTGAAALLWSQNPTWTAQQVKNALMNTGDSIASLAGKTVSGKRLNVFNALAAADLPSVTVSVSPASVQEDGSINLVYTFTRTNLNLSSPLTVNFGASGTANPAPVDSDPADYSVLTDSSVTFNPTTKLGTVTFAANATTATVVVDPIADTLAEIQNETVGLTINSGTGYIGGSPGVATGTIVSEETLPIFTNSNAITIPSSGASTPYPSTINVSGLSGNINSLTVTLSNLSHTWPDDVDVLLVGPTGAKALLMSDVGGSGDVNNVTLTFDPTAVNFLPDSGSITSGSYKPTDFVVGDSFNSPAPVGPYGVDFSVFNNTNPNGTWSLYVMDDQAGDLGSIAGGWSLTLGTTSTLPVISLASNYSGVSENGAANLIYTFTRSGPTTNTLTVNFNIAGTAKANDYTGAVRGAGSITFAAGSATASLTINPTDNTVKEANETVSVTLVNGNGYTIDTPSVVTTTIINDDGVTNQQGTTGNDVMEAGSTRNLSGNTGDDILIGSNSSNVLVGNLGNDTITSGGGSDTISYSLATEGQDTITDFDVLQDIIQVSAAGFGGGLIAGQSISAAQFVLGTVATNASQRFIFNQPTGELYFDVDGNGSSVQTLLATLNPGLSLTENNIFAA